MKEAMLTEPVGIEDWDWDHRHRDMHHGRESHSSSVPQNSWHGGRRGCEWHFPACATKGLGATGQSPLLSP